MRQTLSNLRQNISSMKASILIVKGLIQYAVANGVSAQNIFEASQIKTKDLENPMVYITIEQMNKVWETVVTLTNDRYYGLRCGNHFESNYAGAYAYLIESCRNVQEAMDYYFQFQALNGDFYENERKDLHGEVGIYYHPNPVWVAQSPTAVQCFLHGHFMIILKVLTACTNQKIYPKRVLLSEKKPNDLSLHQQHFGKNIHFEQTENALIFEKSLLEMPFIGHNTDLKNALQQHLTSQLLALKNGERLCEKVKYYLLEQGQPFKMIEDCAADLQMSVRTLQRRLKKEGASFKKILDDIKLDFAKMYLKNGNNVKETAYQLGYTETAAFNKFFKKHMGHSPTAFADGMVS